VVGLVGSKASNTPAAPVMGAARGASSKRGKQAPTLCKPRPGEMRCAIVRHCRFRKKLPQLVSRQFALLRLRGFQFWVTAGTEEHSYRVTPAS
jgi:hypothetical protein